jgi:hypothetical protein
MPWVMTGVLEQAITLPWTSLGIALTSLGNLAVVEHFGTGAKVYDPDLNFMQNLDVIGALQLVDVASKDDILFIVDTGLNKVHVIRDNNVYLHAITVSIGVSIYCAHVNEYDMYVPSNSQHKLFHLGLDANYNKISRPTEIISSGLLNPSYVFADSSHIAINSWSGNKLRLQVMCQTISTQTSTSHMASTLIPGEGMFLGTAIITVLYLSLPLGPSSPILQQVQLAGQLILWYKVMWYIS